MRVDGAGRRAAVAAGPRPARVGLLVEPRYREQRQPARLVQALQERGCEVRDLDLAAVRIGDQEWSAGLDVLLCRGRSPAVLAVLAAAEAAGVRCVNRADAVAAVVNKATMAVRLAAAGIPVPETFVGTPATLADALAARPDGAGYPLILKPVCGDNGRGLRVVHGAAELLGLDWPEPLLLAQRFVPDAGPDLKLYVAGRTVWAVRKPSPIDPRTGSPVTVGASAAAVPAELTEELEKLALRCGDVFGLDLYGVDCLQTPDGPVVLEVNDFPNYSGLPEADAVLARLVIGTHEEEAA
jgi:ribosomal protein S6--L-glutamate ligase